MYRPFLQVNRDKNSCEPRKKQKDIETFRLGFITTANSKAHLRRSVAHHSIETW